MCVKEDFYSKRCCDVKFDITSSIHIEDSIVGRPEVQNSAASER